jgi:hypothetical protein
LLSLSLFLSLSHNFDYLWTLSLLSLSLSLVLSLYLSFSLSLSLSLSFSLSPSWLGVGDRTRAKPVGCTSNIILCKDIPPSQKKGICIDIYIFLDIRKNSHFGTSLLLANIGPNSLMSPKIVNGSHAALFHNQEIDLDFSNKLKGLQTDAGKYLVYVSFIRMLLAILVI